MVVGIAAGPDRIENIGPEAAEAKPCLYIVPTSLELQVEDALRSDDKGVESGQLIDPSTFSEEVIIGVFVRMVKERRAPEETKPPHERDIAKINRLRERSDRWLAKLPSKNQQLAALAIAYELPPEKP